MLMNYSVEVYGACRSEIVAEATQCYSAEFLQFDIKNTV